MRLAVLLIFATMASVVWPLYMKVASLEHRVTQPQHACGPVDTGGGVEQCSQPNILQAPPTKGR